jgi:hypothetical protein
LNALKNLRHRFERFCFQHRNWGIPNLMLYITLGSALVYIFTMVTENYLLYDWLSFDRSLILQGQVWRLLSYAILMNSSNVFFTLIMLMCYYSIGRAMENVWGTLRFNLFYLCGVLIMDVYCMIFNCYADVSYLNLSLFLGYATMYPDAQFLIMFIIPVKAWILGLVNLVIVLLGLLFDQFPYNLFSVLSIANYFLFFGKDVLRVIPMSWRANFSRLFRKKPKKQAGGAKPIPFPTAGSYQATVARPKADYTHRCVVCGRTDVSDPDLEFRYCSRCSGYHCYCEDHINNHTHVEEN